MEGFLVDEYQRFIVELGIAPTRISTDDWSKLDQKANITIQMCLLDSILFNVLGEAIVKALWNKLGTFYQSKSLVNKLFLHKQLYNLRMKDRYSVIKHLNVFNTMVNQLLYVDIKISYEDKCINFLCYLQNL